MRHDVTFDLYIWKSHATSTPTTPRRFSKLWQGVGGDFSTSPFEPSTDVGWFYRSS